MHYPKESHCFHFQQIDLKFWGVTQKCFLNTTMHFSLKCVGLHVSCDFAKQNWAWEAELMNTVPGLKELKYPRQQKRPLPWQNRVYSINVRDYLGCCSFPQFPVGTIQYTIPKYSCAWPSITMASSSCINWHKVHNVNQGKCSCMRSWCTILQNKPKRAWEPRERFAVLFVSLLNV